jgi:large subunit ribosomal protein L24
MKIKRDDNVIVIGGKDRGKTGKVLRAFPRESKVVISGVNLKKLHKRPTKSGQKGQVVEQAAPIHVSNVMIVDPKSGKRTRVLRKMEGDKKVRVAKSSGTTL